MGRMAAVVLCAACVLPSVSALSAERAFVWPEGKSGAVSLSFDDGYESQVLRGTPLFDRYGVKVSFYVLPFFLEPQLTLWKKAVAAGHEIGNHTVLHPCTGNFDWVRKESVAVEDFTLRRMRRELRDTQQRLGALLGVAPTTFAYPCGHTFVGRGAHTESTVPLVARRFVAGRLWMGETSNDPTFVDLAQVTAQRMDGQSFAQIQPILDTARKEGRWVVLVGHEIGTADQFVTGTDMLEALIQYAQAPESGIWLAPVGTVAAYVRDHRGKVGAR